MKKTSMRRISILLFLSIIGFVGVSQEIHINHKNKEIIDVLQLQEDAWNKGDLDGFMKHYWKDENLKFVSKNGIRKGWQAVYDSYQKNYASKGEMGKLNFKILSINRIDRNNSIVNGNWKVENKSGVHEGYFTLWFKKLKGSWVIVMDHTS